MHHVVLVAVASYFCPSFPIISPSLLPLRRCCLMHIVLYRDTSTISVTMYCRAMYSHPHWHALISGALGQVFRLILWHSFLWTRRPWYPICSVKVMFYVAEDYLKERLVYVRTFGTCPGTSHDRRTGRFHLSPGTTAIARSVTRAQCNGARVLRSTKSVCIGHIVW